MYHIVDEIHDKKGGLAQIDAFQISSSSI
jgi:hypothetical protein